MSVGPCDVWLSLIDFKSMEDLCNSIPANGSNPNVDKSLSSPRFNINTTPM